MDEGQRKGFKHGFMFADVLTALEWAFRFPNKQRHCQFGILFYNSDGRLCALSLDERIPKRNLTACFERNLNIIRVLPHGSWDKNARVLAVPQES